MSRPRKIPAISQEDAFDAVCYFDERGEEARDEKERKYFNLAVLAFREVIVSEQKREHARNYVKDKRKNDPKYIQYTKDYQKKYWEQNAEQILEKRKVKRKEAKANARQSVL